MTLPADIAKEAQKLATDRLVDLYQLDLTNKGGELYKFVSSIDDLIPVVSLVSAATLATCVTQNVHALANGDYIRISGATPTGYNGDYSVTVVDPNTFTFMLFTSVGDDASGTYLKATRLNGTMAFDGDDYTPVAFEASGFERNGQGSLPNPRIKIGNVNKVMTAAMRQAKDGVGCIFTRIRTFRKHLDDGSDPNPALIFPLEIYRINRKTAHNKVFVELELASPIDQASAKIPARQCLKTNCSHRYRTFDATTGEFNYTNVTCPYTGTSYFDNKGNSISDPSLDRCAKLLTTGCVRRFGSAPLPFRGFPGIGGQ